MERRRLFENYQPEPIYTMQRGYRARCTVCNVYIRAGQEFVVQNQKAKHVHCTLKEEGQNA